MQNFKNKTLLILCLVLIFSREKIIYQIVSLLSGRLADLLKPDSISEGAFYNVTYVMTHNADDVTSRPVPDEQRLMNHILRGYEKAVRPVQNASTAVIVKMGLTLTQIFDMASAFCNFEKPAFLHC